MHELGITQSIVDIAIKTAREQNAEKVLSVSVEIGELSGVVADAVEFCFEACIQKTFLQGCRLIIEQIPGLGQCEECGAELKIDTMTFACRECGSYKLLRTQGEELNIKELEIE
ncbi:MAG: hydrogenase maturation nickel metallochaperone HypA [Desulfuromonadales bacterium]|nr:hydrogenase maturation nickel metallochaperone HypA [Desulfuromonadales bacterium]